MTTRRTLDAAPLLELKADTTDDRLAVLLGANRQSVTRWRAGERIALDTADRCAVRLGLHPSEVWGNDWWNLPDSESMLYRNPKQSRTHRASDQELCEVA